MSISHFNIENNSKIIKDSQNIENNSRDIENNYQNILTDKLTLAEHCICITTPYSKCSIL